MAARARTDEARGGTPEVCRAARHRDREHVNEVGEGDLPLAGVRVVDLSRDLAGPFAAQLLGDLGADVVKVEHPREPDEMRKWPPLSNGLSTYFMVANRSKRCVTIDLAQPR